MKLRLLVLLIVAVCFQWSAVEVRAEIENCSASVRPNTVTRNTTGNQFIFTITNSDSVSYNRIKITRPNDTLWEITGGDSGSWSPSWGNNDITFSSSSLASSTQAEFSVYANVADSTADSTAWGVGVSEDDGSSFHSCSGSLGTAIVEPTSDQPAVISDVVLSDLGSSSVKITWTTNEATTSIVEYGLTNDYGSTKSNTEMSASHSLTIDGLSVSTIYHFIVEGVDSGGNSSDSGDQTFTTAARGTTTTTTTTVTIIKTTTPTPTPTPIPDRTPPTISINTNFEKPFKKSPEISGRAFDASGVTAVDYSLDDGKNWLPVDASLAADRQSLDFKFTPAIFEDGNFNLKIKAKDSEGNIGRSNTYVLIVDRLPPQVGGVIYSMGPQLLIPNKEGVIFALSKNVIKVTVSAVGGPTEVNILADNKKFSLIKNHGNGLWSKNISFEKAGTYTLVVKAVDGAKNETERQLNKIVILGNGKIIDDTSPVASGKVTLWVFDDQTNRFVVWEGASYGQENPHKLTKDGEYGFFAPYGKYYLEVKSYGYKTLRTEIFSLNVGTPIAAKLNLEKSSQIHVGLFALTLPDFSVSTRSISVNFPVAFSETDFKNKAVGEDFPNVDLFLGERSVPSVSFRNKPAVFTFLSTWSPYSFQQLEFLDELSSDNSGINMIPVISQESLTSAIVFSKRGKYSLPIYSDPDGLLVKPLNLSFLPTSVFVDEEGIVRKVKVGILTKKELLENVIN
jgi:hypothetical protein